MLRNPSCNASHPGLVSDLEQVAGSPPHNDSDIGTRFPASLTIDLSKVISNASIREEVLLKVEEGQMPRKMTIEGLLTAKTELDFGVIPGHGSEE